MKKWLLWIIAIIFIGILILSVVYFSGFNAKTGEFNLEDYDIIEEDLNVGEIKNAEQAKKAGKKLLKDSFGVDLLNDFPPYCVSYDKNNDAWLVQASSIFGKSEGAYVIFRSNGDIIAGGGVKF